MKEEALKLAYEMDGIEFYDNPNSDPYEWACDAQKMIFRLVEELDCSESYIKQYQLAIKNHKYSPETGEPLIDGYPLFSGLPTPKPLSDEEILDIWYDFNDGSHNWTEYIKFARTIEERHGIK